ncbi:SDR family NAD(P)-dependent oxidoreductase (plasmid) [Rhizobium sp. CB3090]|uniref:SDR family NAD(P)-dependent oxidoreductase n=1 Tax=Rhizobium sp. CB3090 TaxID=3039156 RepID=UPI0024B239A1|nr:SDR family oxidoreductase [Rhizobium sp. CB3090]WFU11765.1 SDR family NAD(P)-dependent oxidoreductase [Rhizobium sp. CB3090]
MTALRLENKRALISGGANGAGAASTRLFCKEGAAVVFVDKDGVAGSLLEQELIADGHRVKFIEGDVSKPDVVDAVVASAVNFLGHIDILFNHAGIIIVKPFLDFSLAEWDEMMDNNAKSAFLMSRAVLPSMLERGKGVLVFTSTTGVRAATHLESLYSASKSAMHMLSRSIAVEYRDKGIRSNALCPSFVRTRHGEHEIKQLRKFGILASEQDVAIMQGRICEPEEIAEVALFLASDASSFVNGVELFVDNTFTAV